MLIICDILDGLYATSTGTCSYMKKTCDQLCLCQVVYLLAVHMCRSTFMSGELPTLTGAVLKQEALNTLRSVFMVAKDKSERAISVFSRI